MLKKTIFTAISISLLATSLSFARPQPDACPTVEKIKEFGLGRGVTDPLTNDWVFISSKNSYGTNTEWSFGLMDVKAANVEEARKVAAYNMDSLVFGGGPYQDNATDEWHCLYYTSQGNRGVTLTGLDDSLTRLKKIK